MWPRAILHVDMDAFFASVEQLENPALRGQCVLVGSDRPRGVVAAASYEARKFGCHSAMPMSIAKRRCPHAVIVSGSFDRYRHYSQQIFAILNQFTPLVEPLSIDEAFCDVTGSQRLHGAPPDIAAKIRHRVKSETGLTASVGVAPNKFLAKIASDLHKPDALTVIREADIQTILDPLPVARVWGIGPKMNARLQRMNIRSIGDLRRLGPGWMENFFGQDAEHFYRLVLGTDDRPVVPDTAARQISQETTFEVDVAEPQAVRDVMLVQAQEVAARLRKSGQKAGGVTVKIRYSDFKTITRAKAFSPPTDVTREIRDGAYELFDTWVRESFQPVRLIGVAVHRLGQPVEQLSLFADPTHEKQQKVDRAVDSIIARLGKGSIQRGMS